MSSRTIHVFIFLVGGVKEGEPQATRGVLELDTSTNRITKFFEKPAPGWRQAIISPRLYTNKQK